MLFDTAVGRCGIVWGDNGIAGVLLPESSDEATRSRLLRRHQQAVEAPPPEKVRRACDEIVALLRGEARDLVDIALDMRRVPEFDRRVYEIARTIRPGDTATYGEIARRLGNPGAARAVGRALGANPFPIIVPCHRVLAAGGKSGGFSAPGGIATKRKLLAIESVHARGEPTLFDR
jgi:methylated-DNA-[protein]-cysteine S-methyltransferase